MKKKQLKHIRNVALFFLIGITVLLLAIYIGFAIYFKSHYFWHTTIGDMNCGGKTVSYVEEHSKKVAEDYLLTIYNRDDTKYHLKGTDFDYKYIESDEAAKILAEQNSFLWPTCISGKFEYSLKTSISYDKAKLETALKESGLFNEENQVQPEDATISLTKTGYEVTDGVLGTVTKFDKILPLVIEAADSQISTIQLTDDCYENPTLSKDSPELKEIVATLDGYMAAEITYKIEGADEKLTSKEIFKMIELDENNKPSINDDELTRYVQYLASTYNTYGDKRNFTTSKGDEVVVSGGDFGWVISKSKEKAQILEDLNAGKPVTREPVYEQTANGPIDNDIGNTYLELDYSNQHYYYYKDGVLTLDADIVSGTMSNGMGSPDGIFKIVYCERNARLVGETYDTKVSYFMPFAYNVGFHDAGWRGAFGGEIYINDGSHGCINMNPADAKALFEVLDVGTPVVAYYRTPVELTSESAEKANAKSYVAPKTEE